MHFKEEQYICKEIQMLILFKLSFDNNIAIAGGGAY
jgi:hypothetical protein